MAKIKTKAIQIDSTMHAALLRIRAEAGLKAPTLREMVEHALTEKYGAHLQATMRTVARQEELAGGNELLPGAGDPIRDEPQQQQLPVTDEMKTEMFNGILRLAFGGEYEAAEHIEYGGVNLLTLAEFVRNAPVLAADLDGLVAEFNDTCANYSYQ